MDRALLSSYKIRCTGTRGYEPESFSMEMEYCLFQVKNLCRGFLIEWISFLKRHITTFLYVVGTTREMYY